MGRNVGHLYTERLGNFVGKPEGSTWEGPNAESKDKPLKNRSLLDYLSITFVQQTAREEKNPPLWPILNLVFGLSTWCSNLHCIIWCHILPPASTFTGRFISDRNTRIHGTGFGTKRSTWPVKGRLSVIYWVNCDSFFRSWVQLQS